MAKKEYEKSFFERNVAFSSKKVLKSFAGIEKVRTFALAFRKGGQKRDL